MGVRSSKGCWDRRSSSGFEGRSPRGVWGSAPWGFGGLDPLTSASQAINQLLKSPGNEPSSEREGDYIGEGSQKQFNVAFL